MLLQKTLAFIALICFSYIVLGQSPDGVYVTPTDWEKGKLTDFGKCKGASSGIAGGSVRFEKISIKASNNNEYWGFRDNESGAPVDYRFDAKRHEIRRIIVNGPIMLYTSLGPDYTSIYYNKDSTIVTGCRYYTILMSKGAAGEILDFSQKNFEAIASDDPDLSANLKTDKNQYAKEKIFNNILKLLQYTTVYNIKHKK